MTELPHRFGDPALFELALTHSSSDEGANNERLEFLGDAVLDLVVAEELFHCHAELAEGELTELKAWVVSRAVLADVARSLDLDRRARVGSGMRNRTLPRSVLANLYEGVLGAVYLDAGLDAARRFCLETLAGPLNRVRDRRPGPNHKQQLQQICQMRTGSTPTYSVLDQRGQAHARAFLVAAEIGARRFPSAWGRTRKEAERWAAYEALLVLAEEGEPTAAREEA